MLSHRLSLKYPIYSCSISGFRIPARLFCKLCVLYKVMIRFVCGSILLNVLCSFGVTSINRRSLALEVVCHQSSELKQKHDVQISKHEKSNIYIQSQTSSEISETSKIDLVLNGQQKLHISLHNSKVKPNRKILKIIIKGTCFLANQGLPFCGNDETANSSWQTNLCFC